MKREKQKCEMPDHKKEGEGGRKRERDKVRGKFALSVVEHFPNVFEGTHYPRRQ